MYAAAGGASIASRKARQNKAQGIKAALPVKKPPSKGGRGQPARGERSQSKQFHHLPEGYHKPGEQGSLAPPSPLAHSRSMSLRPEEGSYPGLRASRSAHELPGLEASAAHPPSLEPPVGSPPRAYSCTHWEARLQKTPPDRIVAFGSADVPYAVCEV